MPVLTGARGHFVKLTLVDFGKENMQRCSYY